MPFLRLLPDISYTINVAEPYAFTGRPVSSNSVVYFMRNGTRPTVNVMTAAHCPEGISDTPFPSSHSVSWNKTDNGLRYVRSYVHWNVCKSFHLRNGTMLSCAKSHIPALLRSLPPALESPNKFFRFPHQKKVNGLVSIISFSDRFVPSSRKYFLFTRRISAFPLWYSKIAAPPTKLLKINVS